MTDDKIEYRAAIDKDTLGKWQGVVRVWDRPQSAVQGAEVVDKITEPIEVRVVDEQKDAYGSTVQRVKITYGSKQGWVLADAISKI